MDFNPGDYQCFRFISYRYDPELALASFDYALDDLHYFTETLHFPAVSAHLSPTQLQALDRVLAVLHLVAGISYYKTAMPKQIKIESGAYIDAEQAAFLQQLYQQGLGEFCYENNTDLTLLCFPISQKPAPDAIDYVLKSATVVPLGGGKDSLVSVRLLQQAQRSFKLFSVGQSALIQSVAVQADIPHIRVKRQLSPHLFELNNQGALNGHVPITAIIAYILAASAILYDFDTVVMSNERSASQGNLMYQGLEINHQYSKSFAFERALQAQLQQVLPHLRYFSLLRPLSELHIARLFAIQASHYFSVFSSCNRNFKIIANQPLPRWCLDCPKCRFVFLALAPFLSKAQMLTIFNKNLLDDPSQQAGFDALLAYQAYKPFECVGEIEESAAAFYHLSQDPDWANDYLIRRFSQEIVPQWLDKTVNLEKSWQTSLTATHEHQIPNDFQDCMLF